MDFSYASAPVTPIYQRTIPRIEDTHQDDIKEILRVYREKLESKSQCHMGYPYNLAFDYADLKDFLNFSINNLGDVFIESNYGVHSRCFEIAVLDWFAKLWDIPKEEYWGYLTSCGTEGNLHGIYVGRENFPDGVLYASEDSHYSVFKAARMYRMPCERVRSNPDGTIDIVDLAKRLQKNGGKPAIVNVNIGTTLKGGVDNLDGVIAALHAEGYQDGHDFYIHCDGALVGIMVGILEGRYISFSRKPIGSVSVSGHKFIGSPIPSGIVITRLEHIKALSENIDYINSRDATIMGSRNGHAPLYLWYTLVVKGVDGIKKDIDRCLENADYLKTLLLQRGMEGVMLNRWSNTVVFRRPKDEAFVKKWQLACSGDLCHVVVMPNITKEKLDEFVSHLVACM